MATGRQTLAPKPGQKLQGGKPPAAKTPKLSAAALQFIANHPGKFLNAKASPAELAAAEKATGQHYYAPGTAGHNPQGDMFNTHGYSGIGGVFSALSKGLSADQFSRLQAGYDGLNGAVGKENGAFAGLSPYAVNFLANSGLLTQNTPTQVSMTDASGAALTGIPLLMAQIQQSINNSGSQSTGYSLASGLTQQNLQTALQAAAANGKVFNQGYGMFGTAGAKA